MIPRVAILVATMIVMAPGMRADSPETGPRIKAVLSCYMGKLNSGSKCTVTFYQPDGKLHQSGKLTCGWSGRISEIEWKFVRRRGDNDVYRITRTFPVDTAETATTSKDVEFDGKQTTVFEDKFQCIVISGPVK